jgi:penicillin-binding protein 1A
VTPRPRWWPARTLGTRLPNGWRNRAAAVVFAAMIVVAAFTVTWLLRQGWAVHRLTRGVGDTWFLAADGRRWFRMDEHRRDVPLSEIPDHLQHAFIAIEDHRFFTHPGVDPIALGRAVVRNFRSPGTVEGGSTLTQQLARTLFLSNKKTYGRKAREAVLALMIDGQLSKEQVLELYLNRIYLSAGVYGVETMSRHLFGRPAKQLNLAECALIAGLARAPSTLSPWSNLDGAIARSHVVLARMREEGFITASQEREARTTSIRIRPYPGASDPRAGYAKEFLRQLFRELLGGDHPP